MIYVFGTRMYGKVDQVPGLFHVATQFFHIQFIPLVPVKSWLVFDATMDGGNFRGIPLGWHGKSIFFAWLRFGSFIAGVLAAIGATVFGVQCLEGHAAMLPAAVVCALLAPLLFVLFGFSYRLSSAGPKRALLIAWRHGIKAEAVAEYFGDRLRNEDLEDIVQRMKAEREAEPPTLELAD